MISDETTTDDTNSVIMAQELPNGMSTFFIISLVILPCIYNYMSWIYTFYRSISYWALKNVKKEFIYRFGNSP